MQEISWAIAHHHQGFHAAHKLFLSKGFWYKVYSTLIKHEYFSKRKMASDIDQVFLLFKCKNNAVNTQNQRIKI